MRNILLFIFISLSQLILAQAPRGKAPAIGHIYGKIIDKKTLQPVEFGSVTLLLPKKDSIISGCLTKSNGDFSLENLAFGEYRLRVFFIGYTTLEQNVSIGMQETDKDIGNILLNPDAKVLKEVAITDQRAAVQMTIDRKVYHVGSDLSSKGGTGLDAVKNIPSVTIDADGNVALRNNGVQVYVDGRPTSLSLQQIPSDQIEQIEVITNPSAKFDAGITGGILNVILKRNIKPGYNGMAMLGIGSGSRYNAMLSLNVRVSRFNFSGMYNFFTSTNRNDGYTNRTNRILPGVDPLTGAVNEYYNQSGISTNTDNFHTGRLGVDYTISNRSSISFTNNFTHGSYATLDNQQFFYADTNKMEASTGKRLNDQAANFNRYSGQLQFRHTYPKQGKEFTSDFTINTRNSATHYLYTTNTFGLNQIEFPHSPSNQKSNSSAIGTNYTWQADFTNPINAYSKIELGARSFYSDEINSQLTYNQDTSGKYIAYSDLTNNYSIISNINAVYVNYISVFKGINYQAGLRLEQTHYKGNITNKNLSFEYNYPGNGLSDLKYCFFPAIYLGKKLKNNQELQLNYSRKINRPNFFQLMPFVMFADNANIRIGNPSLAPEFINLNELNYNRIFKKANLLLSLFSKYIENPMTNVAYPQAGNPNILVNTVKNGKNSFSFGMDNTLKLNPIKALDLTANLNAFYMQINYLNGTELISNNGYSYTSKGMITYRFPKSFSLQINATYQAPQIIPQGKTKAVKFIDISVSKNLFYKFNFTLLLSDVFNTKYNGSIYDTDAYYQNMARRRETRYIKFTISYNFGKMTPIKKPKPKQGDQGGSEGMDF